MAKRKTAVPLKDRDLVTAYEFSVNPKDSQQMVTVPAGTPIGDLDDHVLAQLVAAHFTAAPKGD